MMTIDSSTWSDVVKHYREIGEMIVRAAKRLRLPGLVVEFELLPPMTETPAWGAEITQILSDALRKAHETLQLPCALRATPTDVRTGNARRSSAPAKSGRYSATHSSSVPEQEPTSFRSSPSAARKSTMKPSCTVMCAAHCLPSACWPRATWNGSGRKS